MEERLQKILSARGIASRRKAEEYIIAGLVKVNGKVAELGSKADPERDLIEVDGSVLTDRALMRYALFYKPRGVVTSSAKTYEEDEGESSFTAPTLADILPQELQDLKPIGRLDKESEGLLLLTNDGVLAYRLTHPSFYHEKEYEVTVLYPLTEEQLTKLSGTMYILGERLKPVGIEQKKERVLRMTLTEGKNRQIRRMIEKVGNEVERLKRIRIATVKDEFLAPGRYRMLSSQEVHELLESIGVEGGA